MKSTLLKIFLVLALFFPVLGSYGNGLPDTLKSSKSLHLEVIYEQAENTDTLALCFINRFYRDRNIFRTRKYFAVKNQLGRYSFDIDVDTRCGYFILQTNNVKHTDEPYRDILQPYFWESGDSIILTLSNIETPTGLGIYSDCSFQGVGSEKYNLRYKLLYERKRKTQGIKKTDINTSVALMQLSLLNANRERISNLSYNVLKADLIFSKALVRTGGYFADTLKRYDPSQGSPVGFNLDDLPSLTPEGIAESKDALLYLFRKYNNDSFIANGKIESKWIFDQEKAIGNSKLRDEVIVYNFAVGKSDGLRDSLMREAEKLVIDPVSSAELKFIKSINSGKKIYNHVLEDIKYKEIKLSGFKGKILIIDFWIPGCGPCEALYKNVLSPLEKKLHKRKDIAFISVTGDRDRNRWQQGLKSGLYNSASSINLCGINKYSSDPFFRDFSIVKFPTVMLFDRSGNLVEYDSQNLYGFDTLLKLIESLKEK